MPLAPEDIARFNTMLVRERETKPWLKLSHKL